MLPVKPETSIKLCLKWLKVQYQNLKSTSDVPVELLTLEDFLFINCVQSALVPLTHAVVTQAAVRGSGWSEDFAGEAVFQFDRLAID